MDVPIGIQASLAGRYALALFELARDERALDQVSADLETVRQALAVTPDFRTLIHSPLIARADAEKAIAATAQALGLGVIATRFLGVLAENRRLAELPAMIRAFKGLVAAQRGETTAEVVSAHPLDEDQLDALRAKLRQRIGREVSIEPHVDPSILGGLIVRIGSRQIDGSIRTKLNMLAQAMRG